VVDAGVDQTVCDGVQVTLTASGAQSYVWDNGVTDGVAFTPAVGTTTYTVTGTDANGCVNTDQVDVTVNPLPVVNAGVDQTVCDGDQVTLSGSGAQTYVWDNGITDGVAYTPTLGTTTYTVTGTDANGCFNTDQVDVTVNPLPVVNAGVDQTVCDGVQVTLTASGAQTYVWDNGVTDGVAFTPSVGTTTYTVTGTDANGCVNTDQVDVTVNPLPSVNAGVDQTVCDGDQVTLTGSGAQSYVWTGGITDGIAFTPVLGTTTYTVTGTDANGCVNTDDVDVTVNPNPTPLIDGDTQYCTGSTATIGTTVPFAGYDWSTTETTPTIDVTSGSYTVTVTDGNGCQGTSPAFAVIENGVIVYDVTMTICDGETAVIHGNNETVAGVYSQTYILPTGCDSLVNVTLIVNPLPPVNAGLDQTVCDGVQVTLSGSGAQSYTWDNGITDGIAFTPSVGTTTYTVTGTDANGCVNTDQVDVTVNPLPVVNAGVDQTVCDGVQVTLSGSGAQTYAWDNGVVDGVAFTSPVGTTTYTVTGTDANGCVGSDQVDVTVNPLPVVNAGLDQTVCEGIQVTLSGSGAQTYAWDNGVVDGVAFTSPIGTTTYTVTGTDINGCVNTDQVDVTVNPLPAVNAGLDQTVCEGVQVTLSGSGAQSYVWDNGVSDGVAFTSPIGTTTYTVTGTDVNGCVNTDQVDVTVNPNPAVDAGVDQTVCEGVQVTLSGSGAQAYVWDNGVVDGAAFTSPIGTTTYTVTGTDGNGCVNTDQVNVTVNPLPAVDAGVDQTVCEGLQVTLSGSGAQTYAWDNGVVDGVAFTSPIGTTTYTVTGTDANGCVNTDQVDVTVNPLPSVDAGVDQTVCDGVQVTLSGSGAQTYVWDNGVIDGVAFTQAVGTTTYTVTGTDANGCVNSDDVDVTVNPNPVIDAGVDQVVCEGVQVTLSGSGAQAYVWDNGVADGVAFTSPIGTTTYTVSATDANGCSGTDQVDVTVNPNPIVDAGTDFTACEDELVTLNATGAQTYVWDNGVTNGQGFVPTSTATYTVTGTDANGCIGTDDVTVTVEPLPVVSFVADVTSGCSPLTVTFTNTTGGNMTDCIWTLSNGQTLTGCGSVTTTFQDGGLYDVTLTTTSANGCTNTDTYVDYIYVEDAPIAAFTPSSSVVSVLNSEVLFSNTSSGASDYVWNFGDGSPESTEVNPIHQFPNENQGTYVVELIAYSPLGCVDTATRVIVVNDELIFYVPNTFTPDHDDHNELFTPVFTSGYDPMDFNMYIYNRWGELIWESHDASVGWDATYGTGDGRVVQDGTYTWKIDFKTTMSDERVLVVGHVNVLK
jgi:gliding motility-associated-like protein